MGNPKLVNSIIYDSDSDSDSDSDDDEQQTPKRLPMIFVHIFDSPCKEFTIIRIHDQAGGIPDNIDLEQFFMFAQRDKVWDRLDDLTYYYYHSRAMVLKNHLYYLFFALLFYHSSNFLLSYTNHLHFIHIFFPSAIFAYSKFCIYIYIFFTRH